MTKTGLMLGLGEEIEEVRDVLRELAGLGVDIGDARGEYLAPSPNETVPADRALRVHPDQFAELEQFRARTAGIPHVVAGPAGVRSSYHADGQAKLVRDLRAKHAC